MLTLDVLESIELSAIPWGQILTAAAVLMPNYHLPWTKTEVIIEGAEKIPDTPVIYAMNHTDRYNYWPFQYRLWRNYQRYTTTWVKGKYYNNKAVRAFMIKTNNLAVPSRGYLITADALNVLGKPPADKTYRVIREAINSQSVNTRALREAAAAEGVLSEVVTLLDTPRDMLGMRFEPNHQNYLEAMVELFQRMMERFVELNEEAVRLGLDILVFPEGTRSVRLQEGKPGLAQMALRMKSTIVPVGCNGSHEVYPGDRPFSRGGRVVYRVGDPLRPDEELKEFQIADHFTPFTFEAEEAYGETFQPMTELVMDRIEELLDPAHLPSEDGESESTKGANRFL